MHSKMLLKRRNPEAYSVDSELKIPFLHKDYDIFSRDPNMRPSENG